MLTKAEMEKMWQSGPIGILKSYAKNSRGKKLYKIKITPYKMTNLEEHIKVYEIFSKNQPDAIWTAKSQWYNEHYDVNQTGLNVSIVS